MHMICLDMEGVLIPEIWKYYAQITGIDAFKTTTRENPDVKTLFAERFGLMQKYGLSSSHLLHVLESLEPCPGAVDFLDALRMRAPVMILTDTCDLFLKPFMKRFHSPLVLANTCSCLEGTGRLNLVERCRHGKQSIVKAKRALGYEVCAFGDSFNDIAMIEEADIGFLFRPSVSVSRSYPGIPVYQEYDEVLSLVETW